MDEKSRQLPKIGFSTNKGPAIYRTSNFRPLKNKRSSTAIGITLFFSLIILITQIQSSSTKVSAQQIPSPISKATQTSRPKNDIKTKPLGQSPDCTNTQPKHEGTLAIVCKVKNTSMHYEIITDQQVQQEIISSYKLLPDKSQPNKYLRYGKIDNNYRILSLDLATCTLVDINTDLDEQTIKQWWDNSMSM